MDFDPVNLTLSHNEHLALGAYLFGTGFTNGFVNLVSIFAYVRYPTAMLTPSAIPELSLLITDFCIACMHPFSGLSAIKNIWVWGPYGCQLYAFTGFFFGNYQCLAIPFIAYDRYNVATTSQHINKNRSIRNYFQILLLLMAFSFCFSVMPLVGWGRYGLLPTQVTCTIDWTFDSPSYYSYITALAIFLYILPFCAAAYLYSKTMSHVTTNKLLVHWAASGNEKTVLAGCLFSTYIAFSGFGTACVLPFFMNARSMHKIIHVIPAPMAKLAGSFNALFYVWLNPHYKETICRIFRCSKRENVVIKYNTREDVKEEEKLIRINTEVDEQEK